MRCILILALFFYGPALFSAEPEEFARFPDDTILTPVRDMPKFSFGLLNLNVATDGLIFKRQIATQTQGWLGASFASTSGGPDLDIRPLPDLEFRRAEEKNKLMILIGVDRTFYITSNRRLAVILGGVLGYRQSHYEVKLYPRICNAFWCGYNPNHYLETGGADRFGFASARFGFGWLDRQIAGQKIDFVLALVPLLTRWPQRVVFSVPGFGDVDPASTRQSFMTLEVTLRI